LKLNLKLCPNRQKVSLKLSQKLFQSCPQKLYL